MIRLSRTTGIPSNSQRTIAEWDWTPDQLVRETDVTPVGQLRRARGNCPSSKQYNNDLVWEMPSGHGSLSPRQRELVNYHGHWQSSLSPARQCNSLFSPQFITVAVAKERQYGLVFNASLSFDPTNAQLWKSYKKHISNCTLFNLFSVILHKIIPHYTFMWPNFYEARLHVLLAAK